MNKKILVLLASGFEDTELITTINIFRRNNLEYDLFSIEGKEIVEGQNYTLIKPTIFKKNNLEKYDGLFLPGGSGHKVFLNSDLTIKLVQNYFNNKKLVSAICAAPEVLKKANILGSKKFTSFPGFAISKNNTGNNVERSENIITAKDFEASVAFGKKIIDYFKNS